MNILLLNGVNLNLQGTREPAVYGSLSFGDFLEQLQKKYSFLTIDYFQSNEEPTLVEHIQQSENKHDGIILNAGAFTHTSIAIADAVRSVCVPVVEVHISNVFARESYRKKSYLTEVCRGSICGFGLDGYRLAIESFLKSEW